MKNYSIFYYHNLNLSFKSAQTLQVIKDYLYLSKRGYTVHLFGEYENEDDLSDIINYISDSNIQLYISKGNKFLKLKNKINFIIKILLEKNKKIVISRHYKKIKELLFLKKIAINLTLMHEMHEESFPYLFKSKVTKKSIYNLFKSVDSFIFTNFSQVELYKEEFSELPKSYIVLPNGVEINRFKNLSKKDNYILTYLGQFNEWKNVELIFKSLSLLDDRFTLRIAGGKGDKKSRQYIENLIFKYNITPDRVNYLGFIKNNQIEEVLDESNILLLPLGDNIQSKFLTSPMKLFEYMATKIPVLSVNYPTVNLVASDNEIFLSENNEIDFSKSIKKIVLEKKLSSEKISKMNKLVKEYSYEKRSQKFDEFIK